MAKFFKKNQVKSTLVSNNIALSKVLEQAAKQPEYQEVFYRRFLNQHIYVLVQKDTDPNTPLEATPIIVFENNIIPVFTETDRIYQHNAITEDVNYIKVIGRSFLEMVLGQTLIVNPFSKVNKTLVPAEIAEMLSGSIFHKRPKASKAEIQMKVTLGHPKVIPTAILEAFKPYLTQNKDIQKAYLGWIYNPQTDQTPHYIIALELQENSNCKIHADNLALLAKPLQEPDAIMDIMELLPKGDFSDFFYNQSEPFYQK